ncbi:multicopper oxidase-domain-containing protein [Xylariaceae sp. FL0662B]|nr:multicopper oxidase-domain-containing protein [Xylariaceae sp. FL0662B]
MEYIRSCKSLVGELTSSSQNGKSLWGTILAPTLPLWILGHGGKGGDGKCPWGGMTAKDHNPYTEAPDTGITRHYEFNISRGVIAPDGYQKKVILVNDQFPGPLVEANWGDYIEVKVNNFIEDDTPEGTAIHWHGFLQTGNPGMDGVPGVSQCPIAPGKSFTYNFRAELYGSSWYHSHYSAQYSGGLYGPMVVYGPMNAQYDVDLGPIMINDWWHKDYFTVVEEVMAPGFPGQTFSDNNLINGKMSFNCSTVAANDTTPCTDHAGLSKFKFQPGKTHRLRFINSGSEGAQRISIDGHNMTVIANDFVEVEPYDAQMVTIGVGQRVDVVVHAHAAPGSAFWLRANMTSCSLTTQPLALAAVYYEGADENAIPASAPWDGIASDNCATDDALFASPYYPMAVPEPSWTQHMDISEFRNASGNYLWNFGNVTARVDFNDPPLLRAAKGDLQFDPDMNVINYGTNSSIRIIVNNPTPSAHPMHAHGLNMYVLAAGPGDYNGTLDTDLANPPRRDVQMVQGYSHIVVQMDATNAGLWPFHCHVAWHSSAGFFAQLLFRPDDLPRASLPQQQLERSCREWAEFTSVAVPDQIDSGL